MNRSTPTASTTQPTAPAPVSVLFLGPVPEVPGSEAEQPEFFTDLNLDQIVEAILPGRQDYTLKPYFFMPLFAADGVRYRHEVMRDLEKEAVTAAIRAFTGQMRSMRAHLVQTKRMHHVYQRERWYLDAIDVYCRAASTLGNDLGRLDISSRGLLALRDYLSRYVASGDFTRLAADNRAIRDALEDERYCVHMEANRVQVTKYEGETDFSEEVERTFARFKLGAAKDYRAEFKDTPEMNTVEERVLDRVALLYPDEFARLHDYCGRHSDFPDPVVLTFDREIQFYLAYLEYIAPLRSAGLPFCYPDVCTQPGEVHASDSFDLALAAKLVPEGSPVVCNDFVLGEEELIAVVTGPNQGGKTTFARMVGQLHYVASLGLPIPGSEAALALPDQIFTHFEREEDISTLHGKLEDDLVRIHDILDRATGSSLIVMNESFTSTTFRDALLLGTEIMHRILALGARCVYVTFVYELASLSPRVVSMVGGVDLENSAIRTYRIERKPPEGLAHAVVLARKYGLTYDQLRERLGQ